MTAFAATPVSPARRLVALDLLRLIAVVLVLGRHMEPVPENWESLLRPAFVAWSLSGAQGVDLFFVLSGFLVSGLLFAEFKRHGQLRVSRFYIRRALKIYPAFYALIAFTYVYQKFVIGQKMTPIQKASELFFLQSYIPGFWNHTWTLAVEEHFYLALPLLLLWFARRNSGKVDPFSGIPVFVAAIAVLLLAARVVNVAARQEYSHHTHVFATHLRVDSLLIGVVIAYAYHFHAAWFQDRLRPFRWGLLFVGTLVLASWLYILKLEDWYRTTFGFTQLYLGSGAILAGALLCRTPENLVTRTLAEVGSKSYSIYLWHMAFQRWVAPELTGVLSWQARTAIYFATAFVLGIVMAKVVELPVLQVRDRWFPSRLGEKSRPTTIEETRAAA